MTGSNKIKGIFMAKKKEQEIKIMSVGFNDANTIANIKLSNGKRIYLYTHFLNKLENEYGVSVQHNK